ncbi:MAG: hypothetical protein WDN01_13225 [Rhizomicrobium sp.]
MTADAILAWHDFFVTMTQVGATLAGLLFVGLTISLPHVLGVSGYMSRAFAALFLQFEMLVIGLWGLLPAQNGLALGLEFVVTGAAFAAGIAVFSWHFPEDGTAVLGSLGPRMVRRALAVGGTLLPVVAGLSLVAGRSVGLYLLMPTAICCLYLSIGNAWVFAVEIPRRRQRDSGGGS